MIGRLAAVAFASLLVSGAAAQQEQGGGTKADAEREIQAYLALWSRNADIDAASVARFYAPRVTYYGKRMSRAQVLADKTAYIAHWPVRHYAEVPGSFVAACNPDRSDCSVSVIMSWRRVSSHGAVSTGRARISFVFVPVEGGRKIARESARIF